jgi:hypothetical protein
LLFIQEKEVDMIFGKSGPIVSILNESPFFSRLSIRERETLVEDLLKSYPQLLQQTSNDMEVGYEASWLTKQSFDF